MLDTREYKNGFFDCHTANIELLFLCRLCDDEIACGNIVYPKGFTRRFVGDVEYIVFKTQAVFVRILSVDKEARNGDDESECLEIQKGFPGNQKSYRCQDR